MPSELTSSFSSCLTSGPNSSLTCVVTVLEESGTCTHVDADTRSDSTAATYGDAIWNGDADADATTNAHDAYANVRTSTSDAPSDANLHVVHLTVSK